MSIVSNRKLLFLLADDQDRTYYVEGGVVKKSALPRWLPQNPDGWKDITLQFATNKTYFSTLRAFSNAVKFVKNGKQIIVDRALNGAGTEEVMYLIILKSDPSKGLNYYGLEYKSRLDFSKFLGDPHTGISMNTLQDDVFALVQANESANYSIQCNSSNPKAIRALYDGILLQDKLNYEVTPLTSYKSDFAVLFSIPITFINNEGDNAGIVFNSQNYQEITGSLPDYLHYEANANYIMSSVGQIEVTIKGTFQFIPRNTSAGYFFSLLFMKSTDTGIFPPDANEIVFDNSPPGTNFPGWPYTPFVNDKTYTIDIDKKFTLMAGEKLFFFMRAGAPIGRPDHAQGLATSMSIYFSSKQQASLAYVLRPLDLAQDLVGQITNGRFTVQSKFLSSNNRKCVLSGSSLRSFPDAVIQTNFRDFFKSFSSAYNLGMVVRNGVLWIEPVGDLYNNQNELLDLGEVSKPELSVAEDYIYTSAQVGYVKQTYNKRNGRYETNCIHNYKFPIYTVLNKLDLVSPFRADPFGQEFIRTGYPNLNSTDDKGDADVFTVMISDTVGQTDGEVSTAVVINVETLILAAPIIKTPFTNSTVYNQNPTISGIGQANKIITVFADGIADGTALSDVDGNWSYTIQNALQPVSIIFSGVHYISANSQTDPTNISGFSNIVTLLINTSQQSPFLFTTPSNNETLYNNLPVISGIAPSGKVITLKLDGGTIATLVTNSSGLWKFQITAAIADGIHIISATAPGLPDAPPLTLTFNKNVSSPLITSLSYGDILFNNQPLIKGVAIPGTVVSLYLDGGGGVITGGIQAPLGTVVADANGDWSFLVNHVVDVTGLVFDHIPEGQHVFSTTPTPVNVLASLTGYQLMRGWNRGPIMDFDSIKLDDAYIPPGIDPATLPPTLGQFIHPETLYNYVETSPLQMLRAHDNILGCLSQQQGKQIVFNGAEVNANLVTKKDGIIRNERQNIDVSELSAFLFRPWYLSFTTKVPKTFNHIMTGMEAGGYFPLEINGLEISVLPIGTMNYKVATDEAQNWKLLISGRTPLSTLIKLFSNGLFLNLGKNMIYFSQKNPLHFVKYNKSPAPGYHFSDIYDDWQKNRFPRWRTYTPDYAQPWELTDQLVLQGISNGVGAAELQMFSVTTGKLIDTFPFVTVPGSIVQLPNVLVQVEKDISGYLEDDYWFGVFANGALVAISEKIALRADHPDTLKIEYGGSEDQIDFYFSTGIQPVIRVQGEILLWNADSEVDIYEDENGDFETTRAIPLQTRKIQFGSETSLIADWMSLKMNQITLLTNLRAEGSHYARNSNSKWEPQDLGKGIPELLVQIEMGLAENQTGIAFATPGDEELNSVTWTLDALAFGRNPGVINVTTNNP